MSDNKRKCKTIKDTVHPSVAVWKTNFVRKFFETDKQGLVEFELPGNDGEDATYTHEIWKNNRLIERTSEPGIYDDPYVGVCMQSRLSRFDERVVFDKHIRQVNQRYPVYVESNTYGVREFRLSRPVWR